MLKIKIITVGRLKEKWLAEALAEYEKRVQPLLSFEWVLAKTEKQLLDWAIKEPHFISLDIQGELLSSKELSERLEKTFQDLGGRLTLLIGGAEGLPRGLLQRSLWRWSLSPLTFPHQLVRLLLIEQLYRAIDLSRGGRYHK